MAANANANAKDGKWTPDDDLKLIFTCLLNSQGKDLKINGWTDIEKLYNGMPGSNFSRSAIVQRYNKLKREFTTNHLDKLPASPGSGDGPSVTAAAAAAAASQPAGKTGGKRKTSAAKDKEKNVKKARKYIVEKPDLAQDGGDAEEAENYEA